MQFSGSTLRLFAELLGAFSLPSSHPQIVEAALTVRAARQELEAAISESLAEQKAAAEPDVELDATD